MSQIKATLFLLIGLLMSTLIGLLLLELMFGGWFQEDPWKATSARLNIVRGRTLHYRLDNLYGTAGQTVTYVRDAYGLRGSCSEPAAIEILSVGGSTTDQRYIGEGSTYQDVLAGELTAELGRRVCVSNAGVDGHSTVGHIEAFRTWFPLIPGLKPTLTILYVGINDVSVRVLPPARPSRIRSTLRNRSAIYDLARSFRAIWAGMRTEDASLGHGRRVFHEADYVATTTTPGISTFVQGITTQFADRLDTLLTLVKATGAIPVCVSQPHRFVVEQAGRRVGVRDVFKVQGRALNGLDFDMSLRALAAALQSRCEKAGGYFMDIGARPFEAGDFYDGVHMTPSGARRLGGYMFEAMKGTSLMAALTHPPIRLAPSDRATVP